MAVQLLPQGAEKGDQEAALQAVWRRAQELYRGTQLVPEESPVGDSSSNGEVESANAIAEGLIRALNDQTEELLGQPLPTRHALITWIVPHAGLIYTCFTVGPDG